MGNSFYPCPGKEVTMLTTNPSREEMIKEGESRDLMTSISQSSSSETSFFASYSNRGLLVFRGRCLVSFSSHPRPLASQIFSA